MFQLRKSGCSHGPFQDWNAQSTSLCQRASFSRSDAGGVVVARLAYLREPHFLGEEVRRHQHQPADPMILDTAGIDRRDRGAVAVAEQNAALEPIAASTRGSTSRASSSMKLIERGNFPGLDLPYPARE